MLAKYKRFLWLLLPIAGILAGYLLLARSVTLTVDGVEQTITSLALTVRGILRDAGVRISPADEVNPAAGKWVNADTRIVFYHAGLVQVWVEPEGKLIPANTTADTPVEIVTAAGLTPGDSDKYLLNGKAVEPNEKLTKYSGMVLQYTPAVIS